MTYGKGVMGSYASQLTRAQRWMIVKYIRTLQPKKGAVTADSCSNCKNGFNDKERIRIKHNNKHSKIFLDGSQFSITGQL